MVPDVVETLAPTPAIRTPSLPLPVAPPVPFMVIAPDVVLTEPKILMPLANEFTEESKEVPVPVKVMLPLSVWIEAAVSMKMPFVESLGIVVDVESP